VIQAIVFLPLVASILAGLFGRQLGVRASQIITTGAVMTAAVLSWIVFLQMGFGDKPDHTVTLMTWVASGDLRFDWALRVDTLTAVMLVVVCTVSALVHLYSIGYMAEDPHQPRFFSYLSLFTFAMLMLVTADNLVQMFFGWEGVGLASYLLIGFWYKKPTANAAALKAFLVNRVGDFGFSLGIFACFLAFGTVNFAEIFAAAPKMAGQTFNFLGLQIDIMTTIALLLFIGAMGKSAQLGLHTWLPDAMEGPTPVSALIHAATMVTAGVFMLARMSPLFEYAEAALVVVCVVGALTAFFAGTIGTTQYDIKRVIAYSTCSQLGFMFFALGVGAYGAAIFHLFTHAFFKALLFLGAGSVIHAMHHEQDMRFYGGLRKHIPITFWVMTIGTLAIVGFPFLAGFYSKDGILEAAFMSGSQVGMFAYALGTFTALLTSFYSWRLVLLTFFGAPRWDQSEHIQHAVHDGHGHDAHGHGDHAHDAHGHDDPHTAPKGDGTAGYHPHESPWVMLIPLLVLAVGAVVAGFAFKEYFIGHHRSEFWGASLTVVGPDVLDRIHDIPPFWKWLPTGAMALGFLLAVNSYVWNPGAPKAFVAMFHALHGFIFRKWYFDELYGALFVKPSLWLGKLLWKRGDGAIIDGLGPDGVSAVVQSVAKQSKRIQTGYLYHYAFAMLVAIAAALAWVFPKAGSVIGG
jgi:NADH-quinone oxidoreductase subunit L